jgi:hypothetical protein
MNVRIEPSSARYSIQESLNGIRASIPAHRSWFAVLFLCAWLGGWMMGEASAISEIFHIKIEFFGESLKSSAAPLAGRFFLVFWLVGWTLGGAFAFAAVIWQLFGREIIAVEAGVLIHRIEALGIGRTRSFASAQVARLRAVDMDSSTSSRRSNWVRAPALFGQGVGSVAFDYGARSYRIGPSLDEAEARLLIQQLKRWLPEGTVAS